RDVVFARTGVSACHACGMFPVFLRVIEDSGRVRLSTELPAANVVSPGHETTPQPAGSPAAADAGRAIARVVGDDLPSYAADSPAHLLAARVHPHGGREGRRDLGDGRGDDLWPSSARRLPCRRSSRTTNMSDLLMRDS